MYGQNSTEIVSNFSPLDVWGKNSQHVSGQTSVDVCELREAARSIVIRPVSLGAWLSGIPGRW